MSKIKAITTILNIILFLMGLALIALGLQISLYVILAGALLLALAIAQLILLSKWIFLTNRQREIARLQNEESEKLGPFFNIKSTLEVGRLKKIIVDLAHDTRNPISTVLGYADLLAIKQELDPEQAKSIEVIKRNSQSALDVIAKFLAMARSPQSQEESAQEVKQEVHLETFFQQLQQDFASSAKLLGVRFSIAKLTELPARISTNSEKLNAVISVMVSGALRHCNTSSISLEVSLSEIGPSAHKCILFVISYHNSKFDTRRFEAIQQLIANINGEFGHQRTVGSELEYYFKLPF